MNKRMSLIKTIHMGIEQEEQIRMAKDILNERKLVLEKYAESLKNYDRQADFEQAIPFREEQISRMVEEMEKNRERHRAAGVPETLINDLLKHKRWKIETERRVLNLMKEELIKVRKSKEEKMIETPSAAEIETWNACLDTIAKNMNILIKSLNGIRQVCMTGEYSKNPIFAKIKKFAESGIAAASANLDETDKARISK